MLTLYDQNITDISFQTLKELLELVDFPICLCGGWAVYFTVNEYFKKQKDMNYIGSQDIDIGFSLQPMMSKSELELTNLFKMIHLLEQNDYVPSLLGYKKDIPFDEYSNHSQDEGKNQTFAIYVDIIVNSYPPSYQDIYQQSFFEAPIIEKIYNYEQYHVKLPNISKYVFMPSREMIAAMKILSLPSRGRQHKKVKDLCDLYALIWFAEKSPENIIYEISQLLKPASFKRLKAKINKKLIEECEYLLNEPKGAIDTIMNQIF
ncbi:MAG: nucleotidyl transferase AbiEii/AbiGii toxin family protein [Candidatus Thermoplasmatota archaeon]|nr:nucleotidyl transferase AbiEii/AbiGii toxin family protein [Candidatus Thermoplasmatota archaeon]